MQNDREIVINAITSDPSALAFASEELKADKAIVWLATSKDGRILRYASASLRDDIYVVFDAVSTTPSAYSCASYRLLANPDIAFAAVRYNIKDLTLVPRELRSNVKFASRVINECNYDGPIFSKSVRKKVMAHNVRERRRANRLHQIG